MEDDGSHLDRAVIINTPRINWVPGCQSIGESHSGDMEMLWRGE